MNNQQKNLVEKAGNMFGNLREAGMWILAILFGLPVASAQTTSSSAAPSPAVLQAVGVEDALRQLTALRAAGQADTAASMALREQVMERVLLGSFDVDEMLGRIDAEAAHAGDSRYVLETRKERRNAELNIATFAVSGALGTAGSAMQLTRSLDRAGNALNVAAGATAVGLSAAQLRSGHNDRRVFRSPYNMLAGVLGQPPNRASTYPPLVVAYLHSPTASDGQVPDNAAPAESLKAAWYRLYRLQGGGGKAGASLESVTTDPSQGRKLSAEELADREAMLRDLHGAVALLKVELRSILLQAQAPAGSSDPPRALSY